MKKSRKQKQARLDENEWNFDKARVPDAELVPACLWEYSRESRKLRKLRQLCVAALGRQSSPETQSRLARIVARRVLHPVNALETFLRSLVLVSPATNGFPDPWQTLSQNQRTFWAGDKALWTGLDLKAKPYLPIRPARLKGIPPGGGLRPDGIEVCTVEIAWAYFTDKELAACLANKLRPACIPEPKDRGGHKPCDWRAMLVRLGFLRLRSRYTTDDALAVIAAVLSRDQRKGLKFIEPGELNREAEKAGDDFREWFPFLSPAEKLPACLSK